MTDDTSKQGKKSGDEYIYYNNEPIAKIQGFWSWAFSGITTNNLRGIFAEYIVSSALELTQGTRQERDAYDLLTTKGIRIEVKSAAYLQSREQKRLSSICFSIRPTAGYNQMNGKYEGKKRHSDVYVFCVLAHKEKSTVDPCNLNQRDFYCLPTKVLDESAGEQKTMNLAKIISLGAKKSDRSSLSFALAEIEL